ncbi:MAG: hypothetical protein IPF66_25030 [Holophagales bacterium]|nr:hypothetical protein [Holophagales bacterium]
METEDTYFYFDSIPFFNILYKPGFSSCVRDQPSMRFNIPGILTVLEMLLVLIVDDGEVSPSLGFNFVYFNTIVTSITIGNNDAIVMASGQQVSLSNSCPPTTNNMVMPWVG